MSALHTLPARRRLRLRAPLVAAVVLAAVLTGCSGSSSGRIVTVTHPEVPTPTVIDTGVAGPSPGDERIWHFDGEQAGGGVVRTDWVMTTTAIDQPEAGIESRIATGVFTFGDPSNQLILQGVGYYPGTGATLKVSSSTIRSIVGGGGEYAGATGWVESVHNDDGTWVHTFHINE